MIMKEIVKLRSYVNSAEPEVNRLLRNDQDASDLTFDSLFERGVIPHPLYRLMDNKYIRACIHDDIFMDQGYLSCTTDVDKFIGRVTGDVIACLEFDIQDEFDRIDVNVLLPEFNDEKEIILPKGLGLKLTLEGEYSNETEIQLFLNRIKSSCSAREIYGLLNIKKIFYYKASLIKNREWGNPDLRFLSKGNPYYL